MPFVSNCTNTHTHTLHNLPKGDVGDDPLQHLQGGLVDLDKGGVVDLAQAQQLQDLAHLGRDTHDTADTHDQDEVGLRLHKVVAGGAGLAAAADEHALALAVLLHVGLGIAEGTLATLLLAASLLVRGVVSCECYAVVCVYERKCVQDCTSLVLKLSARFLMASLRRRFFSTFSGTVLLQAPHRLDARTAGTQRERRDHNTKQQQENKRQPKGHPKYVPHYVCT